MLQKHSRWITRFLILLSILMMVGYAHAEDDDTIFTVQYFLIEGDTIPPQANIILESVAQNMQALDINVQFERTDLSESQSSSNFSQITFFGDEQIFFVYNTRTVSVISPMLVDASSPIIYTLPCPDSDTSESDYIADELTALLLYITGHYDLAESAFLDIVNNEGLSESPNIDSLYFLLGNLNVKQGDYIEAERHYQSISDNNFEASVNLAWVLLQRGETANAFETINTLLAIAVENEDTLSEIFLMQSRAWLYALDFDYDSAIADMDVAIELAENSDVTGLLLPELYTTRGEIVFLIYEWDRVEDNFNTAIELEPAYAPAYFQRGILFYTVARREDAQADFETYLELAPDGIYVEQATSYIESIEIELEALGN
ncbi:MAG: hypothetical protein AAFV98_10645 [Chloroflexota bacterium]